MHILRVDKFNEMQRSYYRDYVAKCLANGVDPAPQSSYFPLVYSSRGYVRFNAEMNNITWKLRKKDLLA